MQPRNANPTANVVRKKLRLVAGLWAAILAATAPGLAAEADPVCRLALFSADVTVPLGHGMMGGAWLSTSIADPLEAHGLVLLGAGRPVVFVAVDWCEIRNDAFDRWQRVLAEAAGTDPERVMVCTVHQHDAPVADLTAERLLREHRAQGTTCDPAFHEVAVQRVARALQESLTATRPVTHLGLKELYLEHPAPRVAPWVGLQYVGPNLELREVRGIERESDAGENVAARWSTDNGRTWSGWQPVQPSNKVSYRGVGVWEGESVCVHDPASGLLVQLWLRQIEIKGVYHNFTYVRTSPDQGRT